MIEYALLLLIPLMSWLDRQRGCHECRMPKIVALFLLSVCVAVLTGHVSATWQTGVIVAGTMTAWSVGWGQPIGWALTGKSHRPYELWQVGFLRDNPWLALEVRGLMMALPGALALDARTAIELAVAFGVAFPLAPFIAARVLRRGRDAWAIQEYIRGGVAGAILWLL